MKTRVTTHGLGDEGDLTRLITVVKFEAEEASNFLKIQ